MPPTTVLYILSDIWEEGKNRLTIIHITYIFSNNATIPSDIWSVGKEPIVMFQFTGYFHNWNNYWFQMTETRFAEQF